MIDDVSTVMAQLPEPQPPAAFKAQVMARIAREADRPEELAADNAVQAKRRENPTWFWTLVAGLVIVVGASVYGWLSGGSLPSLTAPLIGHGQADLMPMEGPVAVAVGIGLLVYLGGLFAPLAGRVTNPPRRTDSEGGR